LDPPARPEGGAKPSPARTAARIKSNHQQFKSRYFAVPARKREKAAESTVITGGKGSPVRRRTKVMSTVQASDHDAAIWDMRFAKAEMDGEVETDSVGNPYDDDPMGRKRSASRKYRRE
jgi:hypothetical protein